MKYARSSFFLPKIAAENNSGELPENNPHRADPVKALAAAADAAIRAYRCALRWAAWLRHPELRPANRPVEAEAAPSSDGVDDRGLLRKMMADEARGPPPRSSGAPPVPAGCAPIVSLKPAPREKRQPQKNNQRASEIHAEFLAEAPVEPRYRSEDLDELQFAIKVSWLRSRGDAELFRFFCELAARHLIRTSLETLLDQYIADAEGDFR